MKSAGHRSCACLYMYTGHCITTARTENSDRLATLSVQCISLSSYLFLKPTAVRKRALLQRNVRPRLDAQHQQEPEQDRQQHHEQQEEQQQHEWLPEDSSQLPLCPDDGHLEDDEDEVRACARLHPPPHSKANEHLRADAGILVPHGAGFHGHDARSCYEHCVIGTTGQGTVFQGES